jgi:hypothetical protein
MKRSLSLVLAALALAACGEEASIDLSPTVRLDGLLSDETQTLGIYALAGRDKGGVLVTCTSLLNLDSAPGGGAYEVLAHSSVDLASSSAGTTLTKVSAEAGVVVFVEALASSGARIGAGCDTATVKGGETTTVDITVFDLR